ncbi:HD-GYP domain-containing protein [Tundrisphaera sp. TA3]|uniref:HD-GYP domain-containing protein n=1 Tax=Tundrisphaera sp. TA3 TaxID=3435775 RepID=UPI003EB6C531
MTAIAAGDGMATRHSAESEAKVVPSRSGESSNPGGDRALALRLAREFAAPVGLLDPATLIWRARVGIDPDEFPDADASLTAVLASGLLWHGRVSPWRPDRDRGPTWLCLPVPLPAGDDVVALVGFSGEDESRPGWGRPCPERALRAWGQSMADALRGEAFPRPKAASPFRGDGGDRLLTSRLIRRLRVSDPPQKFQDLALHALRGALGVAAVAWVPTQKDEAVVADGAIAGLSTSSYRDLVPWRGASDGVCLVNTPSPSTPDPIRRLVAVAADAPAPSGWIIAINPIDDHPFAIREVEMIQPVASLIGTQRTNGRLYGELKELMFGVIRSLTSAIDAKDPYTSGHSERVARIAVRIAEEMGLSANHRSDLYLMGLLHDVGKIGINDDVLKKPERLTPEEYLIVQSHVEIGVHILSDLKKLHHLLPGVAHHHESYDGKGYPNRLSGESIPLPARILAVADAFDAMSSTRPYRRRLGPMAIDEILRKGAGAQWDPRVVDALFACRGDVEAIRQKGLGESLVRAVDEAVDRH